MDFDWSERGAGETLAVVIKATGHTFHSMARALGFKGKNADQHIKRMRYGKRPILEDTRRDIEKVYHDHFARLEERARLRKANPIKPPGGYELTGGWIDEAAIICNPKKA